ncbi:F-box protein [Quillaja saponaria]|uniref:F-box protein n=1 Tax=Quillaja saponaria TaxID=32244 RepID=A0AAD7L5M6_QUISA|nr:F-box protein [Quillaja saponaria]
MDLLSQLPDEILSVILTQFSTKEFIQAGFLSKTWKEIQASCPSLNFDQVYNKPQEPGQLFQTGNFEKEPFMNYISKFLENFPFEFNIKNFHLRIQTFCSRSDHDSAQINHWLDIVSAKGVEELCLSFGDQGSNFDQSLGYRLPDFVLVSTKITQMKLYGCKLEVSNPIKLPKLQVLKLEKSDVNDNFIKYLNNGCPLIEELHLVLCNRLTNFRVLGLARLKIVSLLYCLDVKKVEIESPNIEAFYFYSKKNRPCRITLKAYEHLRKLVLHHACLLNTGWLQNQIPTFLSLQTLMLTGIDNLKNAKISNHKIENLTISECKNVVVEFDCPNLQNFEIIFDFQDDDGLSLWIKKLKKIFGNYILQHSRVAILLYKKSELQHVLIHDEANEIRLGLLLDDMKDWMPKVVITSSPVLDLIIKLLRWCENKLKTIYVVSNYSNIFDKWFSCEAFPNFCSLQKMAAFGEQNGEKKEKGFAFGNN